MFTIKNRIGKELFLHRNDGDVIHFPKEDEVLKPSKNLKDVPISKKTILQSNFGSIECFNFCPANVVQLPKYESNVLYIVTPEIAMRYQKMNFLYPEHIIDEDEFHLHFNTIAKFHF